MIFPKNDPKNKICSGKLDNLPKSSFVDKMASFFMHFFELGADLLLCLSSTSGLQCPTQTIFQGEKPVCCISIVCSDASWVLMMHHQDL